MSRGLRDPAVPGLLLFAGIGLAGFVVIGLGWRVVARTVFVPAQVPALVSGGMAGLALVLVGAGLLSVQADRRLAARERAQTEALLDEAAALVAAAKARRPA